jgi:hypothetical protein
MDDYLKTLRLDEITPAEKRWLDARLSDMSVKERLILNGLTVYAPPKNGMDVINLVQNIHDCDICFDVGNEDGARLVRGERGRRNNSAYIALSNTKLGEKYWKQHPASSQRNYIEIPRRRGLYDGTTRPAHRR